MAARFVEFELVGLRGFEAVLERASDEVRRQCARVCQDTAFRVMHRAKALAPKDKGDLVRNISAQGKGLNWRVGILDVSLPSRGGSNTAHQNPWVYGSWYEYGFVTRKIQARPFMRPAAEAEEAHHADALADAVNGGLEKAA